MNEKRKPRDVIFIRKVRPRYNKFLVPALIISFIIAVILILILRKYLFQPLLDQKHGLLNRKQYAVTIPTGNPYGDDCGTVFSVKGKHPSLAARYGRKV